MKLLLIFLSCILALHTSAVTAAQLGSHERRDGWREPSFVKSLKTELAKAELQLSSATEPAFVFLQHSQKLKSSRWQPAALVESLSSTASESSHHPADEIVSLYISSLPLNLFPPSIHPFLHSSIHSIHASIDSSIYASFHCLILPRIRCCVVRGSDFGREQPLLQAHDPRLPSPILPTTCSSDRRRTFLRPF